MKATFLACVLVAVMVCTSVGGARADLTKAVGASLQRELAAWELAAVTGYAAEFAGHAVLRVRLTSVSAHAEFLAAVRAQPQETADLWHSNPHLLQVDVAVSGEALRGFVSLAQSLGARVDTLVENLRVTLAEAHLTHLQARRQLYGEGEQGLVHGATASLAANDTSFFTAYHTLPELEAYLTQLVQEYPGLAELVTIGKSVEGQDINGIRISADVGNAGQKPAIVYNGLVHAREWISGATVTFLASQLLAEYEAGDEQVRALMQHFEWVLVPALNPDGYRFTYQQGGNRMWRKNRRVVNSRCTGVDCNRNWDSAWSSGVGTSAQPCSGEYKGSGPFSEPEDHSIAEFLTQRRPVHGYVDFHAYGQLIMDPYGYTKSPTRNHAAQQQLVQGMAAAAKRVNGKHYTTGPISTTIYPASGDSVDWAYDVGEVPFPLAVELRDDGQHGFLLPPSEILPQGREMWAGVLFMGDFIMNANLTAV
jgi:carboxypeptidase A4